MVLLPVQLDFVRLSPPAPLSPSPYQLQRVPKNQAATDYCHTTVMSS